MQQITLALDSDELAVPTPTLEAQQAQRLIAVMAEAIFSIHYSHQGEKADDPDDCQR